MFAEELGGNASRKRAQEAKERRQRLLEQKKKAAANAKPAPAATASNNVGIQSSTNTVDENPRSSPSSSVTFSLATSNTGTSPSSTPPPTTQNQKSSLSQANRKGGQLATGTTGNGETPLSAVQKAAVQRQWRALQITQQQSAIRIQAIARGVLCRRAQIQSLANNLKQKMSDIQTLRTVLLQKQRQQSPASSAPSYCLPSGTVTSLIRQYLFIDTSAGASEGRLLRGGRGGSNIGATRRQYGVVSTSSTSALLEQLLAFVILPGLEASAETKSTDAVSTWISEGGDETQKSLCAYRLRRLLNSLLWHYFTYRTGTQQLYTCILRTFESMLLGTSILQLKCRTFLLSSNCGKDIFTSENSELDLIAHTRRFLLFLRDKPIPTDANEKRDACFSSSDKDRAGAMTSLLLNVAAVRTDQASQNGLLPLVEPSEKQLQARIVKDILTIPLLTWRLSPASISRWAEKPQAKNPQFPLLITLLQAFAECFASQLNRGELEMILDNPDLPMSLCGATGTQRLLANILQLARLIPACNATLDSRQDFEVATIFFRFVAALVHVVPVGTFLSSRESAIAWISVGDGNQKAIVLSPIILEQCKSLLVDSYVRRLFLSAIDTTVLETDSILQSKNDKDRTYERELAETNNSSATSLAAREARVNRNQSFWNSSKWAKKLSKSVTSLLSTSDTPNGISSTTVRQKKKESDKSDVDGELLNAVAAGLLTDTSSISRQLAIGTPTSVSTMTNELLEQRRRDQYSTNFLFALTQTYSILLARWGGGGYNDIVVGSSPNRNHRGGTLAKANNTATAVPEEWTKSFLNVLCFSTPIVQVAWSLIQSNDVVAGGVEALIDPDRAKASLKSLSLQPNFTLSMKEQSRYGSVESQDGVALFYLFLCTFSHVLIITDDVEIHDMDRPLPLHQIRRCIRILKKLLFRATCVDNDANNVSPDTPHDYFGLALVSASSRTMRDLYDRSSRRPMCVPTLWVVPSLMEKEISRCKSFDDYQSVLSTSPVLRVCPYMVPFKRRLKLFERIVTTKRVEIQGENSSNPFHTNPLKPGIPVRITRGRLLEDGIATMNNLGTNMRQRIAVQYYNEAGTRESGIDAGGLFKEFWTDLCAIAFDPNYALFRTTDHNCLYPNPSSEAAHGTDHTILFGFLGRILGKALFEGITIHPVFAHFFLSFLKGDYNFLHMLPDLSTVDSQLYNNLMFLKTYDGDAADLALTFTVAVENFGGTNEIPLIPNGANVDVTNSNKQLYIGLVAKYYVYDRIREQSEAMTRGLFEVVDRSWLRLFNEPELQVLISGASDGRIDIADMKAHCHYAGGYTSLDRTISKFWKVVAAMDEKQQAALLRFVTSCERAPPLGFGSLNPPFTIQRVGILRDGDKLPTSSTCFNILKLPTYSSEKVLRERLLYAVESGAGFELT